MSNKLVLAVFAGVSTAFACMPGAFAQQTGVLIQGNTQINTVTGSNFVGAGGPQANIGVVAQGQGGILPPIIPVPVAPATPQTGVLIQTNAQTNTVTGSNFVGAGGGQLNLGAVLQGR
jgi:hypothetical protein